MISDRLVTQLQFDEGYRSMPYRCTAGALTVGYGYNLDANELDLPDYQIMIIRKSGINQNTATHLLIEVLVKRHKALHDRLPWLSKLVPARRDVFMNMSYQLGETGFFEFKRTIAAAQRGDYATCAAYMLESKWAEQTPKRAERLAKQMQTGIYS